MTRHGTTEAFDVRENSRLALADGGLRRNLDNATATALLKRSAAVAESATFEASRDAAIATREFSILRLRELLDRFRESCARNGVTLDVFDDYEKANRRVLEILRSAGADFAVKSKSMLTEETGLNAFLESNGVEPIETDLGEFIVQLAGEAPSHITAPALHKSRFDVARLFAEKLGTPYSEDVAELTARARAHLREKFLAAKAGITGANFAIAGTGQIAVVENEGNARMCATLPRTHIAVIGAEKLIPALSDLPPFLDVLSKSATGQRMNSYTSILGTPREGHSRHFIVVTKKRFEIAADPLFGEILKCVRCGACQNVCPVFRRISGHGYGFTYGGPIGVMLAPLLTDYTRAEHIVDASTLCGFCRSICPMKIDIPRVIIEHRRRLCEEYRGPVSIERRVKRLFSFGFAVAMAVPFLKKFFTRAARIYFAATKAVFGREFAPFWDVFSRRHFVPVPRKTFFERLGRK